MKIEKKSKKVLSSDHRHILSGKVYVPDCEPKGIFQVVHGMTEHIGRYDSFMTEIAQEGYIVFGYDHLGHGHTVENESEYGYISKKDGWKFLVNDVAIFAKAVKNQYGKELPYILMGHSMGSFIVRINAAHFNWQDKLIIMGTGGSQPGVRAGLALLKALKLVRGDHYISDTIEDIAFGAYNERFPDCGEHGWISTKKEVRDAYEADPLCSFRFTVSAMEDLMHLSEKCNTSNWYAAIDKEKPMILLSGCDDPVGDYGDGVRTIYEILRANGANAEIRLYEGCRHEILNDTCRDEVMSDIKLFLEKE